MKPKSLISPRNKHRTSVSEEPDPILTPLKLPCRTEEENNSDESKATLMSIKCKKKLKLTAKCTKGTQKSPENSDLMLWMECSLVLNIIKFLVCSCLLIFFCDFH